VDVVVVVGSPTSSNSNRLRELAERLGTPAYMIDTADDLDAAWFEGRRRVGLTAGASAPDILVQQVIARLRQLGAVAVRKMEGVAEDVQFPLPRGLGDRSMAGIVAPHIEGHAHDDPTSASSPAAASAAASAVSSPSRS
jgi:4-hydroxy-3-methylbut-2-en-1-yl diphosphate reductase